MRNGVTLLLMLLLVRPAVGQAETDLAAVTTALQTYQPPMNNSAVTDAIGGAVADWLAAGNDPTRLEVALDDAGEPTETFFDVQQVDVTGDGINDVLVQPFRTGLALLVFVTGSSTPYFVLPPARGPINPWFGWASEADLPDSVTAPPDIDLFDATGGGTTDLLATYAYPGGDLHPTLYHWQGDRFTVIFAAILDQSAGPATLTAATDLAGAPTLTLTYPVVYSDGFDHLRLPHPTGQQIWQWSDAQQQVVRLSRTVEPVAAPPATFTRTVDQLRWQINDGELAFRAGDAAVALVAYNAALTLAASENWSPEGDEPDWRAVAAFRRALTLTLLDTEDPDPPADYPADDLTALQDIVTTYQGDILGELAVAFLDGYGDGVGRAAVARGFGAMQRIDLDGYFLDSPQAGTLRFPVDASLLYPVGGVIAYLNAFPDATTDTSALQTTLIELGFPVLALQQDDDGLLLQFDPDAARTAAVPWRLTPTDAGWQAAEMNRQRASDWPRVGGF